MTHSVKHPFLGANALTGTEAISATSRKTTGEKEADADLTNLTLQLERARVLEAEFRALADSARDYAFITLGLDSNALGWNKGAELLLGYSQEEVLGKPGALFFTPEDVSRGEPDRETATALRDGRAGDGRPLRPRFFPPNAQLSAYK
ncbi:MAG: PAS domain S-box protein [Acidobacteriaceae bacterium]|nr:PAS domain S-box protein [Acidobacteriaceae bacterium]